MDCLYPDQSSDELTSHSDSELSNMELESSLKRHSHFFLPPPSRRRPRSVPPLLLDGHTRAVSPMLTVLDGSSSERIDGDSVETEGGGETRDEISPGIRYDVYTDNIQLSAPSGYKNNSHRI